MLEVTAKARCQLKDKQHERIEAGLVETQGTLDALEAKVAAMRANACSDDDEQLQGIKQLLDNEARVTVHHAFSLHNMTSSDNGMQLHLVLTFRYVSCIVLFGAEKPENDGGKKTATHTGSSLTVSSTRSRRR